MWTNLTTGSFMFAAKCGTGERILAIQEIQMGFVNSLRISRQESRAPQWVAIDDVAHVFAKLRREASIEHCHTHVDVDLASMSMLGHDQTTTDSDSNQLLSLQHCPINRLYLQEISELSGNIRFFAFYWMTKFF